MPNSWTAQGPISLPPRGLVYFAAAIVGALALVGALSGFWATLRQASAPGLTADETGRAVNDGTLDAKPIVEIQAPVATDTAIAADVGDAAQQDDAKTIANQAAAAQAVQAKPSKAGGNIDDILTSPTEKPPAPIKVPDEAAPVKSDVPF